MSDETIRVLWRMSMESAILRSRLPQRPRLEKISREITELRRSIGEAQKLLSHTLLHSVDLTELQNRACELEKEKASKELELKEVSEEMNQAFRRYEDMFVHETKLEIERKVAWESYQKELSEEKQRRKERTRKFRKAQRKASKRTQQSLDHTNGTP